MKSLSGKSLSTAILVFTVIGFPGLVRAQFLSHPAVLSDTDRVHLAIDLLRKGIRAQESLYLGHVLSDTVVESTLGGREVPKQQCINQFQTVFAQINLQRLRQPLLKYRSKLPTTGTGDFEIGVQSLQFTGDTARAICQLFFYETLSRGRRTGQPPTTGVDTLSFAKEKGGWRLRQFENLLTYLRNAK